MHVIAISDGGVSKRRIPSAEVTVLGLAGDRQAQPNDHGGPERAVCLLGLDVIESLAAEGHPIAPGTAGSFHDVDPSRLHAERHPGRARAYTRVLQPGVIHEGERVRVIAPA